MNNKAVLLTKKHDTLFFFLKMAHMLDFRGETGGPHVQNNQEPEHGWMCCTFITSSSASASKSVQKGNISGSLHVMCLKTSNYETLNNDINIWIQSVIEVNIKICYALS